MKIRVIRLPDKKRVFLCRRIICFAWTAIKDGSLVLGRDPGLSFQDRARISGAIDKHTQGLIVSNIKLLLNYCSRFYDRQLYTRAKANADVIQRFEVLLK